jgi:hypothetical protein
LMNSFSRAWICSASAPGERPAACTSWSSGIETFPSCRTRSRVDIASSR